MFGDHYKIFASRDQQYVCHFIILTSFYVKTILIFTHNVILQQCLVTFSFPHKLGIMLQHQQSDRSSAIAEIFLDAQAFQLLCSNLRLFSVIKFHLEAHEAPSFEFTPQPELHILDSVFFCLFPMQNNLTMSLRNWKYINITPLRVLSWQHLHICL